VWFVDLSAITDASLVLRTIGQCVGIRDTGEQPVAQRLQEQLAESDSLLVLDNMEQLQPAAVELSRLLEECPPVRLLVTSREPLHLRLEQLLNVEPLAEADGISLFVDRARAVNSAFQLTADNAAAVGELCARLDELPLAIELAASRARLLTPRAILERLGLELLRSGESDRPDRHRSLRAAVAWSYGQLSSAEQRVFRQLAVFVGGCTLDACDAVLGPVDPPGEAHETSGSVGQADQLDLLQSLVDRSLLRSEHLPNGVVRLRMLETIRSFALEQLTISGEETAVRRRHAEHFVALVGPLTDDPDLGSVDWLDCMEAEHDNIRACLRWCLDTGDNTTALTLASAVHRFWWTRGYLREGLRWLEEGLACPDGIPLNQLAWAQHAAGGLAWRQGEYARAEAHYAAGLALRREIGDPFGAAIALQGLASVARDRGDARRSVELWEECLAVFRAASNRPRIARATLNLAIALLAPARWIGRISSSRRPSRWRMRSANTGRWQRRWRIWHWSPSRSARITAALAA